MKRLICCFFLLAIAKLTSAQINLNDSTVSVVAYWELGDKHRFESITEKLQIIENDTTILQKKDEEFSLEVIDSTETYYILKYESIKSVSKEKNKTAVDSLIEEKMKLLPKDVPILFRTDHLGAFEDFHNWEEIKEVISKAVELLSEDFWNLLPEHLKNGPYKNKEAFATHAFAPILTKEYYLSSFKNVMHLFHFHGGAYSIDETYDYTEQRFSPWDGTMIDAQGELWVEDIDEETSYAFMCNSFQLNSDQLVSSYMNYANKVTGNTNTLNLTEIPYVFTEDYYSGIIHIDSGWTTNTYYELRTEEKKTVHMQTIKVKMLFDDEEEEADKQ